MVLHKYGETLYNGVYNNLRNRLLQLTNQITQLNDDILMRELNICWTDHKLIMTMIKDILMYMDRTLVSQQKKTPVFDMGIELFRDIIVRHELVRYN